MTPTNTPPEFSVLTPERLMDIGLVMNRDQIASVALLPMVALELKVIGGDPQKGPEFAVNAQFVDEGNNLYMARATVDVLQEALKRIALKMDELIQADQQARAAQGGTIPFKPS